MLLRNTGDKFSKLKAIIRLRPRKRDLTLPFKFAQFYFTACLSCVGIVTALPFVTNNLKRNKEKAMLKFTRRGGH